MHRGFVKFYRKAYFDGWLSNRKLWTFWSYILLTAEHFPVVKMVGSQRVPINRGQKLFFRRRAASDLNFTEREIRTCLSSLKKTETVTIKTTNKYSVITIANFDTYAGRVTQDDQQSANEATSNASGKRHASDQQTTHNKEIKELKEEIRRLKITPPTPQGGSAPTEAEIEAIEKEKKKQAAIAKGKATRAKKRTEREKALKTFGRRENVRITQAEYDGMLSTMGGLRDDYVERLDGYIQQIGHKAAQKYKDHLATMENWWRSDGKPKSDNHPDPDFDIEAYERELLSRPVTEEDVNF